MVLAVRLSSEGHWEARSAEEPWLRVDIRLSRVPTSDFSSLRGAAEVNDLGLRR